MLEQNTHQNISLVEQIQLSIKEAMKTKDTLAMNATRAIKGEILLFKTSEGGSNKVTDGDILKMTQKLVKQRKEAAEQFVAAGRQELADNELAEAAVMEKFLPKQLSVEEVKAKNQAIIVVVGATSIKDMGKVMGVANKALKGLSDGAYNLIRCKGTARIGSNPQLSNGAVAQYTLITVFSVHGITRTLSKS